MTYKQAIAAVATLIAVSAAIPTRAADVAGVFGQGRTHVVAAVGSGHAFNENYLVLGVGVSYYLIDGLNAGLAFESWTGSDPGMHKVTVSTQYVFYQLAKFKPYVGAFYRRTYVDRIPDIDSAGGRAGVYLQAGRNAFIGAGVVYESYMDCSSAVYRSCSSTYPEVTFTLAF